MSIQLKDKTILVTGAGGFIGSHIVEALLKIGAKVIGLDCKPYSETSIPHHVRVDSNFEYVCGDITDIGDVTSVFAGWPIDMVCHQAAEVSVPMSLVRPDEYIRMNVSGTNNIFDTARRCGVEKIVYASSCAVYDNASPYAYTKAINEMQAAMYRKLYKMNIIGLRYFNVYGPRQKFDSEGAVVPALIKAIRGGQPIIHGDGNQSRDFVFVRDVADANVAALAYEGGLITEFEVGQGESTSINELYDYLCVALAGGPKPIYTPARPGDVRESKALTAGMTRGLLNWNPQMTMTKGLAITCFAYCKDTDE